MDGRRGRWKRWGLMLALSVAPVGVVAAEESGKAAEPARITVEGLGWWENRQARFALERLLGEARGETLNANAVEDAVFLLMAALAEDGVLRPEVTAAIAPATVGGEPQEFLFDYELLTLLPRPLATPKLVLRVKKGVRYVLDEVVVEGGEGVVTAEEARLFFGFNEGWLVSSADRLYGPARVRTAAGRLEDQLRRQGYAEAEVEVRAGVADVDHETGKVRLGVAITVGPRWRVGRVERPAEVPEGVRWPEIVSGVVWHGGVQQDWAEYVRQAFFAAGYPDMRVRVDAMPGEVLDGERDVTVAIVVDAGPLVRVGEVRFEGSPKTQRTMLRRRVDLAPGELLNPAEIEAARYRLARLGVFRRVEAERMPGTTTEVRDVEFTLEDETPWTASLLLGWGSYEQARAGVEATRINLWGRAHRAGVEAVQSLKGSRGNLTYTVPELLGEQIDGSVRFFGLSREETSFQREEFGGTVALRRAVPWLGAEGRVSYTYQSLRNSDNELATRLVDERAARVASVEVALARDRRDNPLRPRRGYRWFGQVEAAATALGGEVDYQRLEVGGSYHTNWGRGRWVHVGLVHGLVLTEGAENDRALPVNKRFFPGGENSLRGYQDGEAAPRLATGEYVGGKTYALLNVEVEQALARSWSAVVFFDALGVAAELAAYPWEEELFTVGAGVRYQTLIGPVRLEYGHNVNPRPDDPARTLHISVGFPF